VLGAMNLDGALFGFLHSNVIEEVDAKKPVFLFGSDGHDYKTPDVDPDSFSSWKTFPISQSGWWREVNVKGALHLDFSDVTFWKKLNASTSGSIGIIKGSRMTDIVTKYLRDFFAFVDGGNEGVLKRETYDYPEVVFLGSSWDFVYMGYIAAELKHLRDHMMFIGRTSTGFAEYMLRPFPCWVANMLSFV
jgi:hypothetical protein